jgi:hypothetical protein
MEATAALQMVKGVFENNDVRACVTKMVLDDDTSTRAVLSHSLLERAQRVVGFEWPVDAAGKKIPEGKDRGRLPFEHPQIQILADLMHRISTFGKYVFGLANDPISSSACTMVDAYRLKRNFVNWLLRYCKCNFDIFCRSANAVVEHHFNNHAFCDGWCSMKNAAATTKASGNLKYRCKVKNAKLYEDSSSVMARFSEPEKLRECHHHHSSQKNESMNKLISRYAPKDWTFCHSMSLVSRVRLAVGIDSVGHEA